MDTLLRLKSIDRKLNQLSEKEAKLMHLWWETAAGCPSYCMVPADGDYSEYSSCKGQSPCDNFMCPAILGEIIIKE